jgi:hypothetical protein
MPSRAPPLRADGSCLECTGGWLCAYHQKTTQEAWSARWRAVHDAYARWEGHKHVFAMLTESSFLKEQEG